MEGEILPKLLLKRDAEAEYSLALLYLNGEGVGQSTKVAISWLIKSADHHYGQAAADLATMYRDGIGVAKDPDKASEYRRIADNAAY